MSSVNAVDPAWGVYANDVDCQVTVVTLTRGGTVPRASYCENILAQDCRFPSFLPPILPHLTLLPKLVGPTPKARIILKVYFRECSI